MTSTPTISINMIAYKAEKYIAQAIQSIVTQSFTDWELIVVDDGSTDSTRDIVATFDDPRIRLLPVPHIGQVSKLRNIGLQASTGDYVMSIDADDIHETNALELLFRYLQEHPDCIAVYGFKTFIDEYNVPISCPWYTVSSGLTQEEFRLNPNYSHTWKNIVEDFYYTQVAALLMPRTTLDTVGYFDEHVLAEDTDYFFRLYAENFDQVHYIPHSIYRHRIHQHSISNDISGLEKKIQRIPNDVQAVYRTLTRRVGLNYTKHKLSTKHYKRHLSVQLSHARFKALPLIYGYALKDPEMPVSELLKISAIEFFRFILPANAFYRFLRPLGKCISR